MTENSEVNAYLSSIYNNPQHAGGFSGVEKLYRIVKSEGKYKIGRHRIRRFLQSQESYSLQRPVRRKFRRNRVIVGGLNAQWDVDIAFLDNIEKYNNGVKFLLVCIDVFSRYLRIEPLKSKTTSAVISGLQNIFARGQKPRCIRHDMGSEFVSNKFDRFLKSNNVKHFVTYNTEIKANFAERVIRTIKEAMYRMFTVKKTYKYIDVLSDLVTSYNAKPHRGLFYLRPIDVNETNEKSLWKKMYLPKQSGQKLKKNNDDVNKISKSKKKIRKSKFKFKVGDIVRVSHIRQTFHRAYHQKWSGELFKINKRIMREGLPVYTLVDLSDDEIKGTFYQPELQSVYIDKESHRWAIEKVLRKRKLHGVTQCLVKWRDFPSKFNSYVPISEIQGLLSFIKNNN